MSQDNFFFSRPEARLSEVACSSKKLNLSTTTEIMTEVPVRHEKYICRANTPCRGNKFHRNDGVSVLNTGFYRVREVVGSREEIETVKVSGGAVTLLRGELIV